MKTRKSAEFKMQQQEYQSNDN